jgi:hypothetical protein
VTEIAAVKLAADAGVKVTEIVQVADAASVAPQVLAEIAKSLGFAPVSVMELMFNVALPGLVSVADIAGAVDPTVVLGKASVACDRTACGRVGVPVPVREDVWGEPAALSAMLRDALKLAAEAGVKLTEILQLDPAASEEPQALVSAKSLGLAPVMLTPVMLRAAVPGFESTTTCALLVVLTAWLPKGTVAGVSVA